MLKPRYEDTSILNLMASIATGLGADDTPYPSLSAISSDELSGRPVLLLIIDGLGDRYLSQFPQSNLYRYRRMALTTVFPSATASAITSLYTGLGPQQHGITGWFTYLRELGSVATILPFRPRGGGKKYSQIGIHPRDLTGVPALSDQLSVPCQVASPSYIAHSDYSRYTAGRARRHGFEDLNELFEYLYRLGSSGKPLLVFGYWPSLDSLAHEHGIGSSQVCGHFEVLDQAFGDLVDRLQGSGALLLATADHGLIDLTETSIVRLEDHPALQDTLVLPLCGEPRTAFCYVRQGQETPFRAYIEKELAEQCIAVPTAELIESYYFGLGRRHPHLPERAGDWTLLMRGNYVMRDRLLSETDPQMIGVHGGLSEEEMWVPLIMVEC